MQYNKISLRDQNFKITCEKSDRKGKRILIQIVKTR